MSHSRDRHRYPQRALCLAIVSLLSTAPVLAQVAPDASAGAHRPGVDSAPNGVPVVNLVAPDAHGLSHNQYTDFNVDKRGLILNNSAGISATQQAGYVAGNPNYHGDQAAQVILNEVTSTHRSSLRGFTEVAGRGADVIVANPNGISVDGAGFINTPRAMLTTGAPVFGSNGAFAGLQVAHGDIRIEGAGLNATGSGQTDLIARSVAINAKVWANRLNVITGANRVDYGPLTVTPGQGDGAVPVVSLDVAAVGGMFANAIHLIGTEQGLGIRHAGELATQAGEFVIDQRGRLELTGKTVAQGDLFVQASAIDQRGTLAGQHVTLSAEQISNAGVIHAEQDLAVHTTGALTNTQQLDANGQTTLTAGTLMQGGTLHSGGAQSVTVSGAATQSGTAWAGGASVWQIGGLLTNSGTLGAHDGLAIHSATLTSTGVLAAGLHSDGTLGTAGDLTLTSDGLLTATGRTMAGGALTLTGAGLLSANGGTLAGGAVSLTGRGLDLRSATLRASGPVTLDASGGDLSTAHGDIATAGDLVVRGNALDNSKGRLQANRLDVQTARFTNTDGQVAQTGAADTLWNVTGLWDNTRGQFLTNAAQATLHAGDLINTGGAVAQAGSGRLTLSAGALHNAQGHLASNGALTLDTTGALDNRDGSVSASGDVTLRAASLDNTGGTLVGQGLDVRLPGVFSNDGGTMQASHALTLAALSLVNGRGAIKALGSDPVSITLAQALTSAAGGFIGGNGAVNVRAGRVVNAGQVYAGGDLDVTSGADLDTTGGALQALGAVGVQAAGAVTTNGGRIEAGSGRHDATLILRAASLNNTHGRVANAGTGTTTLDVSAGALTNLGGTLGGQGDVRVHAGTLTNTQGTVVAGQDAALDLATGDNTDGTLYAARDLAWTHAGGTATNTQGHLSAGRHVALTLASLDNAGGEVAGNGDVTLHLGQFIGEGKVIAGHDLGLALPGDYQLLAGTTLSANHDLRFDLGGRFTNTGSLAAVHALAVQAASLDNRAGATLNSAQTTLILTGDVTNAGRIEGDALEVHAANVTNTGTVIGDTITVHAVNLTNGADLGTRIGNLADPYSTALIAAVDRMRLYVTGTLLNRDASLYTMGDLVIAANASGGRAAAITNRSGRIEGKTITLAGNQIVNERRVFETEKHDLDAGERATNTTTATTMRYRFDDPNPLHHPPYVDPSQIVSAAEIAAADAYCGANAGKSGGREERCSGYPDGEGSADTFQRTETDTVVAIERLARASAEGWILASGDVNLSGAVRNQTSVLSAGHDLTINGQGQSAVTSGTIGGETIENLAWAPTATVARQSTVQVGWERVSENREVCAPINGKGRCWVAQDPRDYTAYDTTGASHRDPLTVALVPGSVPVWMTISGGPSLRAAMSAGSTLDAHGGTITNQTVDAHGVPVTVANLGANARADGVQGTNAAAVKGAQMVGDPLHPLGAISVPSGGLFSVHPGTGSPYLVESDPRFASRAGLLGSDYLMKRLGFDGEGTLKRLGDAFYENRMVTDQLTQLTGRNFLTDDADQLSAFQALMDAGVAVASTFHLAVGVALTPEQMANLTQDMVWMVKQEVNGESVLVPVVYLSAQHANTLPEGAVLAGKHVNLDASGQLTNAGTIHASQDATLKAANLLNTGSIATTGNLSITAAQNLLNAGAIQGGNVSMVAGQNLISTADLGHVNLGALNLGTAFAPMDAPRWSVGTGGTINATGNLGMQAGQDIGLYQAAVHAGHNLTMSAGRDVDATASTLSAGGNVAIGAERDVNLGAVGRTTTTRGPNGDSTDVTTHTVTTITAGGDAAVVAGRDVVSQGAQLHADNTLGVTAGRDIQMGAVTDSQSTLRNTAEGRTQVTTQRYDETVKGTTLTGTQGAMLNAGRDINGIAATVRSDQGPVLLHADRDVNLLAGVEEHSSRRDTFKETGGHTFGTKTATTQDTVTDLLAKGSTVEGRAGIAVDAGRNVLMTGGALRTSAGGVTVSAGDQIAMLAASDEHIATHHEATRESGFEWIPNPDQGTHKVQTLTDQVRTQGTQLTAAGPIVLASGGDQTYQAATIHSDTGTAMVSNGHINFVTATDSDTYTRDSSKHNVAYAAQDHRGSVDTTERQSAIDGPLSILAAKGITIGIGQREGETQAQAIARSAQANPSSAWIYNLQNAVNVSWQGVDEQHTQWHQHHEGLTPAAAAVVTVVVTYFTAGAASGAIGSLSGSAAGSGTTFAAASASGSISAGIGNATIAGAIAGGAGGAVNAGSQGNDWKQAALHGAIGGAVSGALFYEAGSMTPKAIPGSSEKILAHAVAGGLSNGVTGGNVLNGALSAAVAEGGGARLDQLSQGGPWAQFAGRAVLGGAAAKAGGGDVGQGAINGGFGYLFNQLMHPTEVANVHDHLAADYAAAHPGMSESEARGILLRAGLSAEDGFADRYLSGADSATTRESARQFLADHNALPAPDATTKNNPTLGAYALTQDPKAYADVLEAMNPTHDPAVGKALGDYFNQVSYPGAYAEWEHNDTTHIFLAAGAPVLVGGGAAVIGPGLIAWSNEALTAYQAATANYSLGLAAAKGATISGGVYVGTTGVASFYNTWGTPIPVSTDFAQRFSYTHLGVTMAVGATGGMYQTQMYQWADLPNTFATQFGLQKGAVIAANKLFVSQAAGRAAQAAAEQAKSGSKPPQQK